MYRLSSRKSLVFGIVSMLLLALGVLSTAGVATMGVEDVGPAVVSANGDREDVLVDNTADLLANIGRDNIELALAPGEYVVPAEARWVGALGQVHGVKKDRLVTRRPRQRRMLLERNSNT